METYSSSLAPLALGGEHLPTFPLYSHPSSVPVAAPVASSTGTRMKVLLVNQFLPGLQEPYFSVLWRYWSTCAAPRNWKWSQCGSVSLWGRRGGGQNLHCLIWAWRYFTQSMVQQVNWVLKTVFNFSASLWNVDAPEAMDLPSVFGLCKCQSWALTDAFIFTWSCLVAALLTCGILQKMFQSWLIWEADT